MKTAKDWLKQPLVHFLLIGAGLFLLFEWTGDPANVVDARTVVVDREMLHTFMQYRAKAFNEALVEQMVADLTPEEFDRLVDDLVREEVLYREALAMNLEQEDYIIKRRLIQKMEFITTGFITALANLSDDDVAAYYEANKEDYFVEPFVTFTHVFFSNERHGSEQAQALARQKRDVLNETNVAFNDGSRHGDRFLYHSNYVERVPEFVASHFGGSMAQSVFDLTPSDRQWYGPFESPYGFHLVMLTHKEEGRYPDLDEIRARVQDDAQRAFIRDQSEAAIQAIIDGYDVRLVYEPSLADTTGPALGAVEEEAGERERVGS